MAKQPRPYCVVVLLTKDLRDTEQKVRVKSGQDFVFGSAEDCNIMFQHECVAPRHAVLSFVGQKCTLRYHSEVDEKSPFRRTLRVNSLLVDDWKETVLISSDFVSVYTRSFRIKIYIPKPTAVQDPPLLALPVTRPRLLVAADSNSQSDASQADGNEEGSQRAKTPEDAVDQSTAARKGVAEKLLPLQDVAGPSNTKRSKKSKSGDQAPNSQVEEPKIEEDDKPTITALLPSPLNSQSSITQDDAEEQNPIYAEGEGVEIDDDFSDLEPVDANRSVVNTVASKVDEVAPTTTGQADDKSNVELPTPTTQLNPPSSEEPPIQSKHTSLATTNIPAPQIKNEHPLDASHNTAVGSDDETLDRIRAQKNNKKPKPAVTEEVVEGVEPDDKDVREAPVAPKSVKKNRLKPEEQWLLEEQVKLEERDRKRVAKKQNEKLASSQEEATTTKREESENENPNAPKAASKSRSRGRTNELSLTDTPSANTDSELDAQTTEAEQTEGESSAREETPSVRKNKKLTEAEILEQENAKVARRQQVKLGLSAAQSTPKARRTSPSKTTRRTSPAKTPKRTSPLRESRSRSTTKSRQKKEDSDGSEEADDSSSDYAAQASSYKARLVRKTDPYKFE